MFGEIKVNHYVHTLNIDTSRTEIRTDQSLDLAALEFAEHFGPLYRAHFRMKVEVLVPLFTKLLGQHLDPLIGSAENDALVDNQFGVDGVEGLNFVLLVHQNVVMS